MVVQLPRKYEGGPTTAIGAPCNRSLSGSIQKRAEYCFESRELTEFCGKLSEFCEK